jgi:capsular polysaccharide biosynthesis protein
MTYTWLDTRFPLYSKPQRSQYAIDREVTRNDFQYKTFFQIDRTSNSFNIACIQIIKQNPLLHDSVRNFQNLTVFFFNQMEKNIETMQPLLVRTLQLQLLKSEFSAQKKALV